VWLKDIEGKYLAVNDSFAKIFNYSSANDLIGKTDLDLWPLDLASMYRSDDRAVIESGVSKNIEEPIVVGDKRSWVETYKSPVIVDGKVMGTVGFARDITQRKESEANLRLAASVFAHSREGILITTEDGTIIDVNNAFTRITGYRADEVIGKNPSLLKSGRQGSEFYRDLWSRLNQKGHWYGEVWNRRKNGEVYAELLTISTIFQEDGSVKNYVALFSDISTIKDHEKQLEHIAHYDALTGLANRVLLSDRLEQAMVQTSRRGGHLAVAYLDLDGFKDINDRYGHEAGDQLLMAIAANMKLSLREGDTLSRLGGDEFVAVLLDLEDFEASMPTLTRLLNAASQKVEYGDTILSVSASLGVTFYPQSEEMEADQLLRQADQAMYHAKQSGKNRFHLFDTQQDFSVRAHHENVEGIRYALREKQFVLYYQPKVNMRTGEILGVEALIRWQHPTHGILPPAAFLPVIEDHPLAIDLGEWVIDTALTQIELWLSMGLKIPISVNVGARQIQQNDFVERLKFLLGLHPSVSPSMLELEVLETSALEDMSKITKLMKQCKKMGMDFALDDFGTGYSSLTYLKHLPVSLLKIDQSFVRDMLHDPDDLAILEGILGLGTAFRRNVIAEGVETLEHGKMLLQLGCEWAQGYGIAYPMPPSQLPEWIASWHPDPMWFNRSSVSREEVQILYATVVHQAWINEMEIFLKDGYTAAPVLNPHECRFGEWLDCENILKSSDQASFLVLQEIHDNVHALAEELCDLKKHNHHEEAISRIGELHLLRDSLHENLMALIRE
jgi:diguanylate cyclase (GGDEF)-like protein/PAS domain S-box-containing protein